MRYSAHIALALLAPLAGCQTSGNSQIPAVDPFAMYGHTRIAPPGTGSYGVANRTPYYNGSAQLDATTGQPQVASTTPAEMQAFNLVDATKAPAHQVQQTAYQEPLKVASATSLASNESPVRVVERVGPVTENYTELRGMTATDATDPQASLATSFKDNATTGLSHVPSAAPLQFQPAPEATPIRPLPSGNESDRPLPVRGFTPPRGEQEDLVPQPTPTSLRPSATIQAGRFIPVEIATRRTLAPEQQSIAVAHGN